MIGIYPVSSCNFCKNMFSARKYNSNKYCSRSCFRSSQVIEDDGELDPKKRKRNRARKYRAIPRVRIRFAIRHALDRAKASGMPYDREILKLSEIEYLFCECCGVEFDYRTMRGWGRNRDRSPSIDRFDNKKGYTIENVKFICMRCNFIKNDCSLQELETVVAYMKKF